MKVRIVSSKGYSIQELENLLYLEARGAYTDIHMKNGDKHISSYYLGKIGNIIKGRTFVRISRSVIINFTLIKEVNVRDSFCIVQNGEKEIKFHLSPSGLRNLKIENIV